MVYLRGFVPDDLPQVYDLACKALSERYDPNIFTDIYSYWPEGFIVVEDNSGINAFLLGVMMSSIHARILMLAVRDDRRRRGFGTVLLQRFIEACSKKGIKLITLEVRQNNPPALDFYRKLGFEVFGTLRGYYSDGEDAFQMQKVL